MLTKSIKKKRKKHIHIKNTKVTKQYKQNKNKTMICVQQQQKINVNTSNTKQQHIPACKTLSPAINPNPTSLPQNNLPLPPTTPRTKSDNVFLSPVIDDIDITIAEADDNAIASPYTFMTKSNNRTCFSESFPVFNLTLSILYLSN